MPTPLLTTKLYIPLPQPNVVRRARLLARLDEGRRRKLTLLSAPAGFGKTTLLSEWLASLSSEVRGVRSEVSQTAQTHQAPRTTHHVNVAWLSLDQADSDPTRFLSYLVAALQTIAPNIGAGLLSALQSPQPPPTEAILTALLNQIASLPDHFTLVLDDYHLLHAKPIDAALALLLEHQPPQLHLLIATREDPQLPLARLRARGQLTELRAADLRFTAAEAATFLRQVMDLDLAAHDVAALEARTEGWIAGLQLAALSMQGHQDIPGFIRAFAGDHRYIVDYLVEEVLQRQPERVRSFLLQTAILDRLCGELCDAVVDEGQDTHDESRPSVDRRPSSALLEELERANLFIAPLDDQRHWYRYHHLFAEVLAAHLRAEQPDQLARLHQRASAWYEQHGSPADAIGHALAGEDFARAAGLVELAIPEMSRSRQEATMLGWLKALPDQLIRFRPVLSAVYGGVLLVSGELDGVEARLRDAERWLETTADGRERPDDRAAATCPEPGRRMVVVDETAFRLLPGSIAVWRAGQALVLGDVAGTVTYARRALDLIPEQDHLGRGAAAGLLGLAYWTSGDLETAHRTYAEGMARVQQAGHISDAISGAIARADIRIVQGRLHEAMRTYEQALQLAMAPGEPALRGTADLYVGMSELYRERNDLPAATEHLLSSQELSERTGLPQNQSRWYAAMARIREAEGDLDGALGLLEEAERRYVRDFFPNLRPVAALKSRLWIAQGRLGEALDWTRAQGLAARDDLSYGREFEHITLARLLVARSQSDRAGHSMREAVELLQRLLQAAEAGGRTGGAIEILILQALAHQLQGDLSAALAPLARALTLAEPEGYMRTFVDEGPPMMELLQEAVAREIMPGYAEKLLAAFLSRELRIKRDETEPPRTQNSKRQTQNFLIEPLSERERDVLRLLRTDLNGPEIARELMVSLSTIRTHTRNIYTKLEVTNRRAAVQRAEELNLF